MTISRATVLLWSGFLVAALHGFRAPTSAQQRPASAAASGTAESRPRVPWTNSLFRGTPDPPLPFRAERVFPELRFRNPTVLTSAPGTDRLFVAEQTGDLYSIPNDPQGSKADLFLEVEPLIRRLRERESEAVDLEAVYGLTFHPRFAENRYCYVCYVVRYQDGQRGQHPAGSRIARFEVSRTDPPRCDPDSEQLVLTWLQGGHNGGCLKFGPDGCLYVSTGDGGPAFPPDPLQAGQDVSNLLSAILRIDVDHATEDRPYTIPADNPFVSLPNARGEIWAYGLRNPWKMSFDRQTGELWVGDVGWELWELVYRVHKGDNFGWSLTEGRQPVHAERPRGPTPIVPPTLDIPHTDGASVTGGYVYRGQRFPELVGTYVFGDWETRRIWGLPVEEATVGSRRDLVEPTVRVVDFAEDNAGELYLLDYDDGTIHTLARNDARPSDTPFPRRLSESGLFSSVEHHALAPGVLPFAINAEQWVDHAQAERGIGVPGAAAIQIHATAQAIPGSMFSRTWLFPQHSVLFKTLSLDTRHGDPESRRRIETQVLHFDGRDWRGYSYEWNEDQSDAVLVEAEGKDAQFTVSDSNAPGGRRVQSWRFPSRTDCLRCHNPWTEYALAFNLAQLNREVDTPAGSVHQIEAFRQNGLLMELAAEKAADGSFPAATEPTPVAKLARLADPHNAADDLDLRARAYLHVNCAHCHRFGGGGSAYVNLPADLPLSETRALAVRPTQGTFGIHGAQIIAPGDPFRSVLYYRMAKLGPGHMPHLGSRIVDVRGLELVHDWIRQLPNRPDELARLERLIAAAADESSTASQTTDDERARLVAELLETPTRALLLARAFGQRRLEPGTEQEVVAAAAQHPDPAIRDLFEPFFPDELRVERLGESVRPDDILKLAGDAERGRQLFHQTAGIQCRSCHRIANDGTNLGPDLSRIGGKYDRAKLLDQILQPSQTIDPQFAAWLVETTAGKVLTGILVRKDDKEVILRDAQNMEHRVLTSEIEGMFPQQKSLMPELLVRDLTAQQVADLLSYLQSLK